MAPALETWNTLYLIGHAGVFVAVWAAWKRRYYDFVVLLLVVGGFMFARAEQIEYIRTDAPSDLSNTDTAIFTPVVKDNTVETVSQLLVDWSSGIILVFSAALISRFHEWIMFAAVGAVVLVNYYVGYTEKSVFASRLIVSIPLVGFFFFEYFQRPFKIRKNNTKYTTGFIAFYCCFFLAGLYQLEPNLTTRVMYSFLWILFVYTAVTFILLSIPPVTKFDVVALAEEGDEEEMQTLISPT